MRQLRAILFVLIVAVFAFATPPSVASPSDLDPSFGTGGGVLLGSETQQGAVSSVRVQADGRVIALADSTVWRLNADGTPDTTFGNGTGQVVVPGQPCFACIAQQGDGKIVVALVGQPTSIVRFMLDGSLDPGFGNAGVASLGSGPSLFPSSLVVTASGRIVVAGSSSAPGASFFALASFLANGAPDTGFGAGGLLVTGVQGSPTALVQQLDGKLVLAANALVARFQADGEPDPTFGSSGVVHIDSPAGLDLGAIVVQPDGGIVAAGRIKTLVSNYILVDQQAAVVRIDSGGNRDLSFGTNGLMTFRLDPTTWSVATAVALDSRQRIVVIGASGDLGDAGSGFATFVQGTSGFRQGVVVRLNPDGSPDTFFSAHGLATFWDRYSSFGHSVAIQTGDRILVGSTSEGVPVVQDSGLVIYINRTERPALFRFQGGDGAAPLDVSVGRAIEYYYAGFGHYFITATPVEIASLDTSNSGWVRTGQSFKVWTETVAGLSPVCRFFSGETFAPQSSHFYTPYPDECAILKTGTVWEFERNEFNLELPQGPPGQGNCPAGTAPLYRLYNNGQGGAPNHRYTDSLAIFNQMLAQGWSFEGEAQTKVFACGPAP